MVNFQVAVVGELMMIYLQFGKELEIGEGNSLQKRPLAAAEMKRIKQCYCL
jgi:hypothetical protein